MAHRQTQTPEYWSAFQLTASDADYLSNLLLEAGAPKPASDLAMALIGHRVDVESAALRHKLESRSIYQPKKRFALGEELTFPALNFEVGRVTTIRAGNNPDTGAFDVIQVEMPHGLVCEFAASFPYAHRLNDDNVVLAMNDDKALLAPEQLFDAYGGRVVQAIDAQLEKNHDFLRIGSEWFLRALMAEVNIGHLNLAEAVLDIAGGGPLSTSVILRDLGLPPEIAGSLQEISINTALARDERFDDVSLSSESAWFLRRLEPLEVRTMPAPLRRARHVDAAEISADLKSLAFALDDELSHDPSQADAGTMPGDTPDSVRIVLIFPHRRAGTLGWGRRLSAILPKVDKPRIPIKFRDRVTRREFVVWLVKDGRYIFGFEDWYKQNDLPPGADIEVSRGPSEGVYLVDCRRRRPKREWVRSASIRDARLRLDTAQRAVACEFDEQMSVFIDDPATLDGLRGDRPRDVTQAVREAFPEIAKLSPQGNVHASTLYAVVNAITRAAPEEVFAALSASGAYQSVGDHYWHLSEARS